MITATVKHNDNYADIEFPCSEAYLSAKLMEIHVDDLSSITHYISAITEPKELSFLKDRLVNLDELNYLAKRMDSFFGDEETQFFEAIKLEHFTEMKDLINLTFNLDKYTLIKDVSDMGKVGREYLLIGRHQFQPVQYSCADCFRLSLLRFQLSCVSHLA